MFNGKNSKNKVTIPEWLIFLNLLLPKRWMALKLPADKYCVLNSKVLFEGPTKGQKLTSIMTLMLHPKIHLQWHCWEAPPSCRLQYVVRARWLHLDLLTIVIVSQVDLIPTNVHVDENGLHSCKLAYQVGLCMSLGILESTTWAELEWNPTTSPNANEWGLS